VYYALPEYAWYAAPDIAGYLFSGSARSGYTVLAQGGCQMALRHSHLSAATGSMPEYYSERFEYTTLPDSVKDIRLIAVDPSGGLSQMPSVSIFDTRIKEPFGETSENGGHDVPSYDAISYTWGDPRDEECIMIRYRNAPDNSTPRFLSVRKNCADVLRQLAHFTTSRFYWIDAICINQAGKKEREKQVLLMSNVFGLAQCVLACVGMHQDDSEFLAQTLDEFDQSLASHHTSIDILTIRATESGNVPWITTSITEHSIEATCAHCFEWVKQLDAPTTKRLFKALDQFGRRPYFWRIWILQELCLPDRFRFLCGRSELRLSTLLFWWRDARAMSLNHRNRGNSQPNRTSTTARLVLNRLGPEYLGTALWRDKHYVHEHGGSGRGSSFEDMLYGRQTRREGGQSLNRRLMAIPDILTMCEYRQCQDPRDCVFGTLVLGNWRSSISLCKSGSHVHAGDTIQPDYSIEASSLALVLLPGFHDTPQINLLVMGMLGIEYTHCTVQEGLRERPGRLLDINKLAMMPPRRVSNDAQQLVHMVEGGIQLSLDSTWSFASWIAGTYTYMQILDAEGRSCAITTVSITPGDWLIPTHYGRGFVLRRCGTLYSVVGKAYCPPDLRPDEFEMVAFMTWYNPEDLLVHLVGGLRGLGNDNIDPPSKETLDHLQIGLCKTENSSFAQPPTRQRSWPASEFTYDTLSTCEVIVRDCYKDNNYYWFC
jgi:hypothetical protein